MSIWFITGCSSGIGKGIAEAALRHGNKVAVTALEKDMAVIREMEQADPDNVLALALDVTDEEGCERAVKAALEKYGRIDVLMNNAGYGYRAAVEESEKGKVQKMFEANFYGPMHLIQLVLPSMRENRSGTIINTTSIGSVRGAVGNGCYGASKAALALLTDSLYKELEPLGIRVMNVEPGAFRTNFYNKDALTGTSKNIDAYKETAGKWHVENSVNNHDQPGNPEAAGELIVSVAEGEKMPKHLPMGSDAYEAVRNELQARLAELEEWKEYTFRTDFKE